MKIPHVYFITLFAITTTFLLEAHASIPKDLNMVYTVYPRPLKLKSPKGLGIHPSLSCLSSFHGFNFFISLLSRLLPGDLFFPSRRAHSFFFSDILWLILAPVILPSLCYVSTTSFLSPWCSLSSIAMEICYRQLGNELHILTELLISVSESVLKNDVIFTVFFLYYVQTLVFCIIFTISPCRECWLEKDPLWCQQFSWLCASNKLYNPCCAHFPLPPPTSVAVKKLHVVRALGFCSQLIFPGFQKRKAHWLQPADSRSAISQQPVAMVTPWLSGGPMQQQRNIWYNPLH